ncbi:quinone oxidoreductase family protein [Pseudonocardia acaciae]|uniref:quinone oxidoreductase family protein n=1 Tax=Pseudonocardia acaciae TaxID=551276 RepID=UPI00048EB6F4|nr:NADP-dependent oxidoreductase [Pseudonocardia acaciae]
MARVVVANGFGGPEVLSMVERPVRDPGPGEVTIRVRAVGVNPLDYVEYSGALGTDRGALPLPVGHELAGVVTAVGAGAAGRIRPGDEVIAYHREVPGAYASEVTWPAEVVVPKPVNLGWEQAAGLLLVGTTAVHALTATGVGDGDTVLIHGVSGGVGLVTAQLARLRGAAVIGTAGRARHEMLRGYGVEPVEYGPGLADRVRDSAGTRSVDAAIDAVGTDEAIDTSLALVADRARIATLLAFQRGNDAGIKTLGNLGGATDPGTEIRADARARLVSLAEEGKVTISVARTFPLAEAPAAHRLVATGHAGGKVVLLP